MALSKMERCLLLGFVTKSFKNQPFTTARKVVKESSKPLLKSKNEEEEEEEERRRRELALAAASEKLEEKLEKDEKKEVQDEKEKVHEKEEGKAERKEEQVVETEDLNSTGGQQRRTTGVQGVKGKHYHVFMVSFFHVISVNSPSKSVECCFITTIIREAGSE